MPKDDPETTALKNEINSIVDKFKEAQSKAADCSLSDKCGDLADCPKIRLAPKKFLKGILIK